MKIRIIEEIPTAIKPKVGEVYEVMRTEKKKRARMRRWIRLLY